MSAPDFRIEMATIGDDCIVGIQPPIDNTFREHMYDVMDDMQLMKEIVVRGGTFFENKSATDGSPFSELRISGTALAVAGVRLVQLSELSRQVLQEQNKDREVYISPYLKSAQDRRQLFDADRR
jgi:hypothetical protein